MNLWEDIDFDPDQHRQHEAFTAVRVAAAEHWPFLAEAADRGDFDNRLAIISDSLDRKVAAVSGGTEFAVLRSKLAQAFEADWHVVAESRQVEAQRRNAPRAAQRSARRRFLKTQTAAAKPPAGWSVELHGLSDSIQFTHKDSQRRLIWVDQQWYTERKDQQGKWFTVPAPGVPYAETRNKARQVGSDWLTSMESEASRKRAAADFVIPDDVGARDVDPDVIKRQIGAMNVMAISGGRVNTISKNGRPVGISLPVSNGYAVNVFLADSDTYTVQRVFRGAVKGEQGNVYNSELGEVAYQAGMFRSNPFGGHAPSMGSKSASEDQKCSRCGKPATHYAYQEGTRASGLFACAEHVDAVSDGRTVEKVAFGGDSGFYRITITDDGGDSDEFLVEGQADLERFLEQQGVPAAQGTYSGSGIDSDGQRVTWGIGYPDDDDEIYHVASRRKTAAEYGDQSACGVCGGDIEYHGEAGWLDRGGNSYCDTSGHSGGHDQDGIPIPLPHEKHTPFTGSRKQAGSKQLKCQECAHTWTSRTFKGADGCPSCGAGAGAVATAARKTAFGTGEWSNPIGEGSRTKVMALGGGKYVIELEFDYQEGSRGVYDWTVRAYPNWEDQNPVVSGQSPSPSSAMSDSERAAKDFIASYEGKSASRRRANAADDDTWLEDGEPGSGRAADGYPVPVGDEDYYRYDMTDDERYASRKTASSFPDGCPACGAEWQDNDDGGHGDIFGETAIMIHENGCPSEEAISMLYGNGTSSLDDRLPGYEARRKTAAALCEVCQEEEATTSQTGESGRSYEMCAECDEDYDVDESSIAPPQSSRRRKTAASGRGKISRRKTASGDWVEHWPMMSTYEGLKEKVQEFYKESGDFTLSVVKLPSLHAWGSGKTHIWSVLGYAGNEISGGEANSEDEAKAAAEAALAAGSPDQGNLFAAKRRRRASRRVASRLRSLVSGSGQPADANSLNSMVEFDSPFEVHEDGTVTTYLPSVYGPEVSEDLDDDGQSVGKPTISGAGWDFVDGYSGQSGYSGPVMHNSEYLGGGMARDVLAEPGIYCVTTVEANDPNWDYSVENPEPTGWALLRKSGSRTARRKTAGSGYLVIVDGSVLLEDNDLESAVRQAMDLGYVDGYVTNQDGGRADLADLVEKYATKATAGVDEDAIDQREGKLFALVDGDVVLSRHATKQAAQAHAKTLWAKHQVWAVVRTATGTNPYLPADNPFAVSQTPPGTPDDLMDGPYDPMTEEPTSVNYDAPVS